MSGGRAYGEVLVGPTAPPELHVMTYNLRRPVAHVMPHSPDRWETRRPFLAALLAAERPSILGTQEAMPQTAGFVRHSLGRHYRSVGHGRSANGRGEGCPLFYDTERLERLDWTQRALSPTPEVPGSTGWGNRVPRILVAATFRDRATSVRFLVVNTHFDHLSRRARVLAAGSVRAFVASRGLPAIVTGDLNSGEATTPLQELLRDGGLLDAYSIASSRLTPEWGSFPNYGTPRLDRKRIDWIATTPDIEVVEAGINPHRYAGGFGSDHLPVQAVLRMPVPAAP
ncbi:endonuclease/exonuclease/phosphatase family protein [Herbiconiux sp. CPCC 205716]|uniref:Endonuclease/exonuclease/phosphatase family protein n=1 Tax=Herbiconiux gentiana TaxID=2970912 RepID=A0ABT2GCX2_9MICO|nr:endonuclease/exonuclease/phosphatase family protein [Herbiconiux gentiana]MCS5713961.1 endonuclease/exonuclease/phosphatase family protein [Herbiconiux gentiana]